MSANRDGGSKRFGLHRTPNRNEDSWAWGRQHWGAWHAQSPSNPAAPGRQICKGGATRASSRIELQSFFSALRRIRPLGRCWALFCRVGFAWGGLAAARPGHTYRRDPHALSKAASKQTTQGAADRKAGPPWLPVARDMSKPDGASASDCHDNTHAHRYPLTPHTHGPPPRPPNRQGEGLKDTMPSLRALRRGATRNSTTRAAAPAPVQQ